MLGAKPWDQSIRQLYNSLVLTLSRDEILKSRKQLR